MIPRAAATLYALAGVPPQPGAEDAPAWCVVCAARAERTVPYERWQGANFTDQNKLRGLGLSERICEPCVWAHAWNPPPGWVPDDAAIERKREAKRKAGKEVDTSRERAPNLRLFWHAYDERGYVFGTKGDKPTIRAWLLAPKTGAWWCAVPDSGQKHVLPWTPINPGPDGRLVRFEEQDVVLGDEHLVDVMTAALSAGVTKAEIERGDYSVRAWMIAREHVERLRELGEREHGSAWWSLAVWLAQRDEDAVTERLEAAAKTRAVKAARKAKTTEEGKTDGRRAARRGSARGRGGAAAQPAPGVPGERDGRA